MIAPCSWISESSGAEYGVFLVVTKVKENTDMDYNIAGKKHLQ